MSLPSLPIALIAGLFSFGAMCGPALASEKRSHVQLTLELQDGSRLIGKSSEGSLRFTSEAFGKIDVSLEKIRAIEVSANPRSVRLTTSTSDALPVQFATREIRLETAYGKINVPVSLIKEVRVAVAGKTGRTTAGLLGLWSGEQNTINSVTGISEANQGVAFTDGVAGRAFSFAPGLGYFTGIQVMDEPKYALTNSFTIEGWIRPRGDGYVIFYRGDHRPGLDPYALSMQADDRCLFAITDQAGHSASVEATVPYFHWTHVAATLDGQTGAMKIFTNAVLAAEIKTDIRPFGELLADQYPGVGIGNVNDGGNNFPFVGDIDEISLYGRALRPDEIHAIYQQNAENANKPAGPFPPHSRLSRRPESNTKVSHLESPD